VIVVDSPALALAVLGCTQNASGVSDDALAFLKWLTEGQIYNSNEELTHARAVNVDFLGCGSGLVVKVQDTVDNVECGILHVHASEDAAISGIEGRVLDITARVNGNNTEGLGRSSRSGQSDGGGRGGEDNVPDLHHGELEMKEGG
jgi:hypothetical protein